MPLVEIAKQNAHEVVPGYTARFIHTEQMTFAYWHVYAGATLPLHSHEHEQVAHVLEGVFELTVDGVSYELVPGKIFVIPRNIPHSGRAITDCSLLDVFNPVRADYQARD
jgi:quercetin dioxygenase-like cupin family protein